MTIPEGGAAFRVVTRLNPGAELFRTEIFCSPRCVRAFCLESLETLEALDTPAAKAVVSDLHELHRELTGILAAIQDA